MELRTQEDHAKEQDSSCPVCGADAENLTFGEIEVQGRYAYQPVDCLVCNHTWNDVYAKNGYSELRDPEDKLIEVPPLAADRGQDLEALPA